MAIALQEAGVREGADKAEKVVRAVQNHVSRMVRVFKKEGGVEQGRIEQTSLLIPL